MNGSVRPSARPSVTPFWLCSHHRIIIKFSGVITNDISDVHAKGHGQRSKVKVTEVNTHIFRTVTPVWIQIWWWNYAQSLMLLRSDALLFFNVIRLISKSVDFDPNWSFPDCNSSLNSPMATKWCTKIEVAWKRCPIVSEGHLSNFKVTQDKKKIIDFDPNWAFPDCNSSLNSLMAMEWCTKLEAT